MEEQQALKRRVPNKCMNSFYIGIGAAIFGLYIFAILMLLLSFYFWWRNV